MDMQTSAVENGGSIVKIGKEEWEEIQDYSSNWSAKVEEMEKAYSESNTKIPERIREELDWQKMFWDSANRGYCYLLKMQSRRSDFIGEIFPYWIDNSKPASYIVSYDEAFAQKDVASFSELMGFLALGVVKGAWTVDDAIGHVVTNCRANMLIAMM